MFGKLLYSVFSWVYPFGISIAAPFNQKARLWSRGRANVMSRIKDQIGVNDKIIWMHCSSLGEFEQGRPVLEGLKKNYTSYKILLTFFSPSGYEIRKNYTGADYIFYLPADSARNAQQFYETVKPDLVIFVKYEFWYYYLAEAKRRSIPLLLISAIFRKSQPFFSSYGKFYRSMLFFFTHFFVQNAESVALLASIGIKENVSPAGDTRFDRVVEIAEGFRSIPSIQMFAGNATVIVAGSTWLEDDKELAHFANTRPAVKFIVAPHNIGKDRLEECLKVYKNAALFSAVSKAPAQGNIHTIIIDNMGMLSSLYKYATICYIGGGFGADGVHNVLEAAVYGKPVVFGPEYEKFNEAVELVGCGGAISIHTALELEAKMDRLINNSDEYNVAATAARNYVYSKKGSTATILAFIQENRLLTN